MAAPYPNKSQFTTTGDPIQEKAQSINEPSQRKTKKKRKSYIGQSIINQKTEKGKNPTYRKTN